MTNCDGWPPATCAANAKANTLQPTALLHEAYVKLASQANQDRKNRARFFGVSAHLMRQSNVRRHPLAPHKTPADPTWVGKPAALQIDQHRRTMLARHHTVLHVVNTIALRDYDAWTTGAQIGVD